MSSGQSLWLKLHMYWHPDHGWSHEKRILESAETRKLYVAVCRYPNYEQHIIRVAHHSRSFLVCCIYIAHPCVKTWSYSTVFNCQTTSCPAILSHVVTYCKIIVCNTKQHNDTLSYILHDTLLLLWSIILTKSLNIDCILYLAYILTSHSASHDRL